MRTTGVPSIPFPQPGATYDSSASAHSRRLAHADPVLIHPESLRPRRGQVRPAFSHVARSTRSGHVRDYLLHLVRGGASWSLYNQVRCALHFFYRVTLGKDWPKEVIVCAKRPRRLPVILSRDEVRQLLSARHRVKTRALLMTLYAAGPRVSELVHLKVRDIDSQRMVIRVEQGKGQKDRYVMLSAVLLGILRAYWKAHRPTSWLFPGTDLNQPLDGRTVQTICRAASRRPARQMTVNSIATVILKGQCDKPGSSPRRSLLSVNQ
jgi:site-specific recombinase XerD